MMIYIIIFLLIIIFILSWFVYNLFNQTNQLKEYLNEAFDQEDHMLKVYDVILKMLIHTKIEFEKIDFRGSFSTDDEVGFSFKALQSCIDTLLHEIEVIKNAENETDRG